MLQLSIYHLKVNGDIPNLVDVSNCRLDTILTRSLEHPKPQQKS